MQPTPVLSLGLGVELQHPAPTHTDRPSSQAGKHKVVTSGASCTLFCLLQTSCCSFLLGLQCPPGCSPFQLEDFPGHRNVFYLQVPSLRDGPFLDSYLSPLSFLFSILFPLVLPSFMEVFLPFWESKVVDQHSVDVPCESFHL